MSKKILFSSILSLLVLFFVGSMVLGDLYTATVTTQDGGIGTNSTLFKAGSNITLNLTVTGTTQYATNITAFNVTLTNDLDFMGWVECDKLTASQNANYDGNPTTLQNATCWANGATAPWSCYNTTIASVGQRIQCNTSNTGTPLSLAPGFNNSIILRINVKVAGLVTESQLAAFNFSTTDNGNKANYSFMNATYIDGQAPRITSLNITDGNMTYLNGTNYGLNTIAGIQAGVNGGRFDGTVPLTVTATVTDIAAELGSLRLYYNPNTTLSANTTAPSSYNYTKLFNATSAGMGSGGSGVYKWTIPATDLLNGNTLTFSIEANDTTNHRVNLTAFGKAGLGLNVTINSTVPKLLAWNMTDGTNWVKNGNGYLKAGSAYTVYVDASGLLNGTSATKTDMTGSNVTIYYVVNGRGTATISNESVDKFSTTYLGHGLTRLNLTNLTTMTPYAKNTWKSVIPAITDSQRLSFLIVASEGPASMNYTTISRGTLNLGFNITADSTAPSVTLTTTDLDATIETSGSITYTCAGSDSGSGVSTYKFVLDKPGEPTAVDTGYGAAVSKTFTSSDTNKAGAYTVYCYVKDTASNEGSTTKTFNAQYSSGSGGSSGGGGGSSTPLATTPSIDLSKTVSSKVTVTQGASKTFTLDGKIEHKVTIDKVTATKVTLTLMSAPVTLELEPGQVELVDLDADGVKDVKVTLNKITGSNADITIEKLAPTAPVTPTTPTTPSTPSQGSEVVGGTTPESQESSSSWVWWLVGIIVVAGLVYLIFFKKR